MRMVLYAFIISFILTVILALLGIPFLRKLKIGQTVREDGPRGHLRKSGTPTMGGILFLLAVTVAVFVVLPYSATGYTALFTTLGFGLIGFLDDFIKVVLNRSLGLKARYKLLGQFLLAALLGYAAAFLLPRGYILKIPLTGLEWNMGYFFPFFGMLVMVSSVNAVNLTDGLDGLAAGLMVFVGAAYLVIALVMEQIGLAVFAAALVGGCLGFLVFNRYPAKVFMGDTGSLALGAAAGSLAILTSTEVLLLVIGGVFVLETISVIIQVFFFKTTGKRFFLMSPIHHHFELAGWPEQRVVRTFWFIGALFAVLGVLGLYNLA